MTTKDGRSQIWYADGSGNVAGYTKSVDDIAGTIIDAYNEHFGTDIQIWTPETKNLQVGGTVPNWNAYEKIEVPKPFLWKLYYPNSTVAYFGKVEDNVLIIFSEKSELGWIANESGVIIGRSEASETFINSQIKPKLQSLGITINSYDYETSYYKIEDTVDNWNEYTLLA